MRFPFVSFAALYGLSVVMTAPTDVAMAQETAQSEHYQLQVETIAEPLEHPWGLALLPDGRFLVTERNPGNLRVGTAEGELSDPLDGIPEVYSFAGPTPRTQGGLFDVELHPQFEETGIIYISLAVPTERGAAVKVLSARLEGEGIDAQLQDIDELWVMQEDDQDPSGLHFGGRMAIDPDDGSIYLSIGERRSLERAQDPEDQAGSVLRMTAQGEPHPQQPTFEAGEANEYLFTMGNRNIQALAFHPETGELWAADHGPEGGDRVDRLEAGQNYGWPFIAGGPDYSGAPIGVGLEHEGMVSPIHVFEETVAPSGLVIYGGEMFPEWSGDLLIGGLQAQGLVRVRIEGDQVVEEEWITLDRRIRDVQIAGDGSLWLITEHEDGEVLRLSAADPVAGAAGSAETTQ
jgi:aldose sugar dehydrogenase